MTPSERERRIEYRIDANGSVPILHDGLGCRPATPAEVAFEAAARDFAEALRGVISPTGSRYGRTTFLAIDALLAKHRSFSGEEGTEGREEQKRDLEAEAYERGVTDGLYRAGLDEDEVALLRPRSGEEGTER